MPVWQTSSGDSKATVKHIALHAASGTGCQHGGAHLTFSVPDKLVACVKKGLLAQSTLSCCRWQTAARAQMMSPSADGRDSALGRSPAIDEPAVVSPRSELLPKPKSSFLEATAVWHAVVRWIAWP